MCPASCGLELDSACLPHLCLGSAALKTPQQGGPGGGGGAELTSLMKFMKRPPKRQALCRWHCREFTVICGARW